MNNTTGITFNSKEINGQILFSIQYFLIAITKLGLSVGLSIIISIEREMHSHPGGACTHALVGIGSCLYTMISVHLRDKYNVTTADPARICAQIVSGMGFLGSATIFKSNNYVKGINTAANLWISAAISMAIGADLWELGLATSFFVIIILFINNRYKKFRYGKIKKDDDDDISDLDIEMANSTLSRDPANAPYGDENDFSD